MREQKFHSVPHLIFFIKPSPQTLDYSLVVPKESSHCANVRTWGGRWKERLKSGSVYECVRRDICLTEP